MNQRTSPTPGQKSRAFLVAGVFAVLVTAVAAPLGLFDWLPMAGGLLDRGGAVSGIALLVIAFSLWIGLFAVIRLAATAQERRAAADLRRVLVDRRYEILNGQWMPAPNTVMGQRVAAFRSAPDQATAALAARSELDHARSDVSYVPARALVWALPALGFLGTAAEMSRAVGGLGGSVGATTNYADLRNALVSDVIPPLADAFGATLFALGAGVLCHLLLTWTTAREQRTLLDVEEVTLELVGPPAGTSQALNGELDALTTELTRTRTEMTASARQVAGLDLKQLLHLAQLTELAPLLRSLDQRLDRIHAELARDLVITRLVQDQKR
jgi:hypothetical protein